MRLGVLSDTHNREARTQTAVELFRVNRCDVILHCGDLCQPAIAEICAVLPFHFVLGNHDDSDVFITNVDPDLRCHGDRMSEEFDGLTVAMIHGHDRKARREAEALQPDILLFGHSHVAADDMRDGIRHINPGALHRTKHPSVAIIDTLHQSVDFFLIDPSC